MIRSAVIVLLVTLACPAAGQNQSRPLPPCGPASSLDQDRDGLSDECELALAQAFAPLMQARSGGCNWDAAAAPARLGGGSVFAAQRVDSVIRIAYMPAYFRDCGWSGLKCWIPGVDCSPHAGDSEFIAVDISGADLARGAQVTGVFLSAHCFGRMTGSCRWYRGDDLAMFEWVESAPAVWVSKGRQANYASKQACDRGHNSLDTCDGHDARYRFPVLPDRNIGSHAHPSKPDGCVAGRDLGATLAEPDVSECFWRATAAFNGWQRGGTGVTGYFRYLNEIAALTGPRPTVR